MKKLTFFVALIIGLNASVVVRKPEEESSSINIVKDYSMAQKQTYTMWLQRFIQKLTINFYGMTKSGEIHTFSWEKIQGIIKKKKIDKLEKISKNWLFYQHHEEGDFHK